MKSGWKVAKGNKNADLKIISLGMGVQSTAVYLMSSMEYKLPRADYAVFADPQAEHPKTYEMLDWLLEWQKKNNGIEIIVNNKKTGMTEDEYRLLLLGIFHLQLGARKNEWKFIKGTLQRQLRGIE